MANTSAESLGSFRLTESNLNPEVWHTGHEESTQGIERNKASFSREQLLSLFCRTLLQKKEGSDRCIMPLYESQIKYGTKGAGCIDLTYSR